MQYRAHVCFPSRMNLCSFSLLLQIQLRRLSVFEAGSHSVGPAGPPHPPVLTFLVLGLQVCVTMPSLCCLCVVCWYGGVRHVHDAMVYRWRSEDNLGYSPYFLPYARQDLLFTLSEPE